MVSTPQQLKAKWDMSQRTSFYCATCCERHKFPAYVFAHWDEELVHTCANCGAKHSLLAGCAEQTQAGTIPAQSHQPTRGNETI